MRFEKMNLSNSPTKGTLINLKKSLQLAKLGFDLIDKKRNILIREMMKLIDVAKSIRGEIESTFEKAYKALQTANITLGICENIANTIKIEDGIKIKYRSIMGVEIPKVTLNSTLDTEAYGFFETNSQLDVAYICFDKAKRISAVLAEIENSVYRLAKEIRKTQRRANALKNINIPKIESEIKTISNYLEEKEREEFSRLKIIKKTKIEQ